MAETSPTAQTKETPVQKRAKAADEYFAALKAGNKQLAKKINDKNNLQFSEGNHS